MISTNNTKRKLYLISCPVIIVTLLLSFVIESFSGQIKILEPDIKAIWKTLDELGQAMVREDIDLILNYISPNMDKEAYDKIKITLEEKFKRNDYIEYKFIPPLHRNIKVLEPDRKVKFKARYLEEYRVDTSGSGSSNGLAANFVMEKINGKWLILDTDFYTKEIAIKIFGVTVGGFVLLCLISFVFWLRMLVDCAKRDFPKPDDKIIWVLIIIFTYLIGAIIYYFLVKRKLQKTRP